MCEGGNESIELESLHRYLGAPAIEGDAYANLVSNQAKPSLLVQ